MNFWTPTQIPKFEEYQGIHGKQNLWTPEFLNWNSWDWEILDTHNYSFILILVC